MNFFCSELGRITLLIRIVVMKITAEFLQGLNFILF